MTDHNLLFDGLASEDLDGIHRWDRVCLGVWCSQKLEHKTHGTMLDNNAIGSIEFLQTKNKRISKNSMI